MIGYACLPLGYRDYKFKRVLKKNLSKETVKNAVLNNLESLDNIIEYNLSEGIKMFRITSDLIPFGLDSIKYYNWKVECRDKFLSIGEKIKKYKMRVSFHPGQYTVINSKDINVVENSIKDLRYHTDLLNLLDVDNSNKIILHVGGVYGNKKMAIDRFIENYKLLDEDIRKRLVIENDQLSYNVVDLLYINSKTGVALVFDNLHNKLNPPESKISESEIIKKFNRTWKEEDGKQKIHYSQQDNSKILGAHSRTIDLNLFKDFIEKIDTDIDIMLEVKDKDLSAIKVNNFLYRNEKKYLERQWAKYKYNVLERHPKNYLEIRELLKDEKYNIIEFYKLIDESTDTDIEKNKFINGYLHVWGYFKKITNEKEKKMMKSYENRYLKGTITEKPIKSFLLKLSIKYKINYLINSYYFNF